VTPLCEHALFYTSAFLHCLILSAIDGKSEQCICIKFCVKLGKSATETLEILHEAFGEHSLNQTAGFEWHSHFNSGQVSVEDNKRSELPSTSKMRENVETI
jgi:hypothetical protein